MGKRINEIKQEHGIGGPPMLHGSDLPSSVRFIHVVVGELREAPANFKSPAILDFAEPVHGKESMAINMTNLRALARLAGFENPDDADFDEVARRLRGKKIRFELAMVNNPETKQMTKSLFVSTETVQNRKKR